MKKTIFLMILLGFICCNQKPKKSTRNYNAKDFEKYDLSISNVDYDYDLNSGKFKIVFSNYIDSIKLTNEQKNKIAKVFFENYIDTLKGENDSLGQENLIMPNFNDVIKIKVGSSQKSELTISSQVSLKSKLNETDTNIFLFKESLFKILNENSGFKKCTDTLKIAKRKDKRLFL